MEDSGLCNVPAGYEVVPETIHGPVSAEEGWRYWHIKARGWMEMTKGIGISSFRENYPVVGIIVRPTKKETPTPWDAPEPSTGMKDLADKLDTAQLKEPRTSYKENFKALYQAMWENAKPVSAETLEASKSIYEKWRDGYPESPKPDPYTRTFAGKLDPYRIELLYGPFHPAQAHAIKKLLRAGKSHKTLEQDIREARECLDRWEEMLGEDRDRTALY